MKCPQGEVYTYWTHVESERTFNGPRQHTVATLGKLSGLYRQVHVGWTTVDTHTMRVDRLYRWLDALLPIGADRDIRLRTVSRPENI